MASRGGSMSGARNLDLYVHSFPLIFGHPCDLRENVFSVLMGAACPVWGTLLPLIEHITGFLPGRGWDH